VIEFQRATKPLAGVLGHLLGDEEGSAMDPEVRRYLRDVYDHVLRVTERVEGFRDMLSNILNVNLTLVGVSQNDEAKRISAWAAILFTPTLIASIYGMNFEYMPELRWMFGYPFALTLMVLIAVVLQRVFKRAGWL
jgi:magnesium transporter